MFSANEILKKQKIYEYLHSLQRLKIRRQVVRYLTSNVIVAQITGSKLHLLNLFIVTTYKKSNVTGIKRKKQKCFVDLTAQSVKSFYPYYSPDFQ